MSDDEYEDAYIVVDLNLAGVGETIKPGETVTLRGLGTDTPSVVLPNGTAVEGLYKESLGTYIVFEEARMTDLTAGSKGNKGAHKGGANAQQNQQQGAQGSEENDADEGTTGTATSSVRVQYLCHTTDTVQFVKKVPR